MSTPIPEMVERVARAINPIMADLADMMIGKGAPRENVLELLPLDQARAAIEAMREPTAAMCEAGFPFWGGSYLKHVVRDLIPNLWRAMIDAALNEEG